MGEVARGIEDVSRRSDALISLSVVLSGSGDLLGAMRVYRFVSVQSLADYIRLLVTLRQGFLVTFPDDGQTQYTNMLIEALCIIAWEHPYWLELRLAVDSFPNLSEY